MKAVINTWITTYSNNGYDEEGDYRTWSKSNENDIKSISVTKDKKFFDLIIEKDFDLNKPCYLVFVEYSSGDSFGEERGCLEYIKVFKTKEEAELFKVNLNKLEEYADSNFKNEKLNPKLFEKIDTKYSCIRKFEYFGEKFCLPYGGYFDNLEKIEIKELFFVPFNKDEEIKDI